MQDNYYAANIHEFLAGDITTQEILRRYVDSFDCSQQNLSVHRFLKSSSIDFAKKGQAVTYLVFSSDIVSQLVGYFTITIKPITVPKSNINSKISRKLERVCHLNEASSTYHFSAYLIAQIGKNYSLDVTTRISGSELLQIAENKISEIKLLVGGVALFLESENVDMLKNFYESMDYRLFSTRIADKKSDDMTKEYLQYIKII